MTGQAIERPLYATSPYYAYQIVYRSPWYGGYYNNYYGYRYGCGSWCYWNPYFGYGYGRYGFYDPWYYGYDSYASGGYSTSRRDDYDAPKREVGSIRIKAKPADANVYIDGVLVGIVDDFDGLTNHLELDAGPHQLEIRATGYESLVKDISVKNGKTLTERLSLKKR